MESIITEFGNYSIVCSLNERSIYLKITDNIGFLQYESNIDSKELYLNIDLSDSFMIIKNCFEEEDGYQVKFLHTTGTLKLQFNALVGGFLKMNFDVYLKERVLSSDGQITMTMNKLEQKISGLEKQLHKKNEVLQDLTEKLSYSMICLWNGQHHHHLNNIGLLSQIGFTPQLFVHMNIKSLTITDCRLVNLELIQHLYQLNTLTLNTFHNYANIKTSKLSSKTVTELTINDCNINSLDGLNQLPLLNKLVINGGNALTNVPTILSSYPHIIKHLSFQGCPQINVVEIQTYCQKNNIELNIK
jgi:hypothetical protein